MNHPDDEYAAPIAPDVRPSDEPTLNYKWLGIGILIGILALVLPHQLSILGATSGKSSAALLNASWVQNKPYRASSVPNFGDHELPDAEDHQLYTRKGLVPSETEEHGPIEPPKENENHDMTSLFYIQSPQLWSNVIDVVDPSLNLMVLVKSVDSNLPLTLSTIREVNSSTSSPAQFYSAISSAGIKVKTDKTASTPLAHKLVDSKISFPSMNIVLLQTPVMSGQDANDLGNVLYTIHKDLNMALIGISSYPFQITKTLTNAIENHTGAARELAFSNIFEKLNDKDDNNGHYADVSTASVILGAAHDAAGHVFPGLWSFGTTVHPIILPDL